MLLHKRRARRPSLAARSSRKAVCGKKGPPASTGQSEMHRACASCTGKIDLTGVPPPVRQAYLIAGPEHSLHHYRRIRHTTASEHRRRSRFFSALRRRASQAPPFRPSKSQKRATEKKSRRRASEQTCEEKPLFLPFSERGPFAPPPSTWLRLELHADCSNKLAYLLNTAALPVKLSHVRPSSIIFLIMLSLTAENPSIQSILILLYFLKTRFSRKITLGQNECFLFYARR